MGCGCGGGAAAARQKVTGFNISDDPRSPKTRYLTEAEANAARSSRQLHGDVIAASAG